MLTLFLLYSPMKAQTAQHRKTRFPVGLYTTGDSDIYGLSVGVGSDTYQNSDHVSVRSNGIRIEPVSQSLLIFTFIFPVDEVTYPKDPGEYPDYAKKIPNEVINGLNLSCGTNAFADVYGVTASLLTQSLRQTNGLSVTGLSSLSFRNNGLQAAAVYSESGFSNGVLAAAIMTRVHDGVGLQIGGLYNDYRTFTGLQIGIFNGGFRKPEKFTGLQIGLFNNAKKLRGLQIGLINKNEKRILPFINW